MPKTRIIPVGWETAGHRFQGMLAEQLRLLVADGTLAAPAPDADGGDAAPPAQDPACLYRFGATPAGRGSSSLRQVVFWPPGGTLARSGRPGPTRRDTVVVTSEWARGRAIAAGAAPARVAVVPPGVDGAVFSPLSRAEREAVRANFGLAADETVLLNVGDSGGEAGLDLLFRAMARLRGAGRRVRLLLKPDDAKVDYDAALREAEAAEPGLDWRDTLAAVATVPMDLAPAADRLLYGAADVLVLSARACPSDLAALEAIACGCPVLTMPGGAGDGLLGADLCWRIPGDLGCGPAEGADGGPDLDALTDALAAVSDGRGFDRLRFAAARMALLRTATWQASARALSAVLTGEAPHEAARPTVLHGLPQPAGHRFAVAPARDLASVRRRARTQLRCPGPRELSVVVQGPCLRRSIEPGAPSLDEAIASIRTSFPGAEVVVSTWIGSDVDGLDADVIVLSPDPGPVLHPLHKTNNVNRVLTSTANGLAAATRPFCIKTRNDVLFASDALSRQQLHLASVDLTLERRIWCPAARLVTSLRPYHPCDMVHYGQTRDLRRLWSSAPFAWDDLYLPDPYGHLERMAAEQAIFVGYLRGLGLNLQLEMTFDGRYEVVAGSVHHMLGAFDVFDYGPAGVTLSHRFRSHPLRPRLYETHESFEALRSAYAFDPDAACRDSHNAFHRTLNELAGRQEQGAAVA